MNRIDPEPREPFLTITECFVIGIIATGAFFLFATFAAATIDEFRRAFDL